MKYAVVAGGIVFLLLICCVAAFATVAGTEQQAAEAAAGSGDANCIFQQTGCVLAVMAQTLEDHVWGPDLNQYSPCDLALRPAYQKWLADCGGSICSDMAPGNL